MAFVGIHLGMTKSMVAVYEPGIGPRVLRDLRGNEAVPSCVGVDAKTKEVVVGDKAQSQLQSAPNLVVEQVRRKMGRNVEIEVADRTFTPSEITAEILAHLKRSAEKQLNEEVDRCVITVPANFPDRARRATKQAGELAGMKVERIINEPTAAALSYNYSDEINDEHILVYDLGGGTFDVSIVHYRKQGQIIDVRASAGDKHLGGKDFDEALAQYVTDQFEDEQGITIEPRSGNYYRLLFACEDAKKALSFNRHASVNTPFFTVKDGAPVNLDVDLDRSTFEELVGPMIDRTESSIRKALSDADLETGDIDRVVLVGGSTRIPYVRTLVERVMGQKPRKRVDPDKAVALGAAVQASVIDGNGPIISDVVPFSLGTAVLEQSGRRIRPGRYNEIIESNTKQLKKHTATYNTVVENQETIDFRVYQRAVGSDSMQAEIGNETNKEEGFFRLARKKIDVPSGPAGQKVEVTYTFNVDGILEVTIHFPHTGASHEFQVDTTTGEESTGGQRQQHANSQSDAYKESDLYEEVEALMEAANRELENGSVPDDREKELRDLLDAMKRALVDNEIPKVHDLEEKITDLLFEVS